MKKLLLFIAILLSGVFAFAQSNVTVASTVPQFYTPNQTMYPGAPPTCYAHEITFNGLDAVKTLNAQIWYRDVTTATSAYPLGFFRQATTYFPLTTGSILTSAIRMYNSTIVLLFSNNTKSNMFTMKLDYQNSVIGQSVNLGPAPAIFSVAQAYDAGLFNATTTTAAPAPEPATAIKKRGHR